MSQNPTFEPTEFGTGDQQGGLYAPNTQSNMASYRQATTGPPADSNGGKSYRYATSDPIAEGDEEMGYDDCPGDPRKVNFENGGEPTKRISRTRSKSDSGVWQNYGAYILIALVVLFGILFVVFAILYGLEASKQAGNSSSGAVAGAISDDDKVTPGLSSISQTSSTTTAAPTTTPPSTVTVRDVNVDGVMVKSYTLKSKTSSTEVELLSLGARVNSMKTSNGVETVIGFNTAGGNLTSAITSTTFGSADGRLCGQTAGFSFGGNSFTPKADSGLYQVNFASEEMPDGRVKFTTTAANAQDDLPGSANIEVIYSLGEDNTVTVEMMATSASDTLIDMCSSMHFNLGGGGAEDVSTQHRLMVNSKYNLDGVEVGSVYDFSSAKSLDALLNYISQGAVTPLASWGYMLKGATGLKMAGMLSSASTNAEVTIHSNQNYINLAVPMVVQNPVVGRASYGAKSYIMFTTKAAENAASDPAKAETILLKTGATYKSTTVYKLN